MTPPFTLFKVKPYGLTSISAVVRPPHHISLTNEIHEYLSFYRSKLADVHELYKEKADKANFDPTPIANYLYEPRYISTLGHVDLRVDFLVDDMELAIRLPLFDFAGKQRLTFHLIPDIKDALPGACRPLLLDEQKYFTGSNAENLHRLPPLGGKKSKKAKLIVEKHPFQFQVSAKVDSFLRIELGIQIYQEIIIQVFKTAKKVLKEKKADHPITLKIFPLLNFDWHEISFIFYSNDLDLCQDLTDNLLLKSMADLPSNRSREQIKKRSKTSFISHRVEHQLRNQAKICYQHIKRDLNFLKNDYASKLEKTIKELQVHPKAPLTQEKKDDLCKKLPEKNVFYTVYLQKYFREHPDELSLSFKDAIKFKAIFKKLHPVLVTNTTIGFPNEVFLYYLADKDRKHLERVFAHGLKLPVPAEGSDKENDNVELKGLDHGAVINSALRGATPQQLQDAKTRIAKTWLNRVNFIERIGVFFQQVYSQYAGNTFSATIDLAVLSFHLNKHQAPARHQQAVKELKKVGKKLEQAADKGNSSKPYISRKIIYGHEDVRLEMANISFIQLLDELGRVNDEIGRVQYVSSKTTITQEPNGNNAKSDPPAHKIQGYSKLPLKHFRCPRAYNILLSRMRDMEMPEYLIQNMLSLINLYNDFIQDKFLFESMIELSPVIRKLEGLFLHFSGINEQGVLYHTSKDGKTVTLKPQHEIVDALKDFLELFKSHFHKQYGSLSHELPPFQFSVESRGTYQQFLWIAAGVQRALMTLFFSCEEQDKVMYRAGLLGGEESNLIIQTHRIVPFVSVSMMQLTYSEHLNLMYHEIGHFYGHSDMYDALRKKLAQEDPKLAAALKAILDKKPVYHPLSYDEHLNAWESTHILSEIIPDLYYLHFGCQSNMALFEKKLWFHFHSIHQCRSKPEERDIYKRHIIRLLILKLVQEDAPNLNHIDSMVDMTKEIIHTEIRFRKGSKYVTEALSKYDKEAPNAESPLCMEANIKPRAVVAMALNILRNQARQALRRVDQSLLDDFEKLKKMWDGEKSESQLLPKTKTKKRHATREENRDNLRAGWVLDYKRFASGSHTAFLATSDILQLLLEEVLNTLPEKGPVFLEDPEGATKTFNGPSRLKGFQLLPPQNTGPAMLYPGFGVYACGGKTRGNLFRIRAAALMSLVHVSLKTRTPIVNYTADTYLKDHMILQEEDGVDQPTKE